MDYILMRIFLPNFHDNECSKGKEMDLSFLVIPLICDLAKENWDCSELVFAMSIAYKLVIIYQLCIPFIFKLL